jgi:hypothetical protein
MTNDGEKFTIKENDIVIGEFSYIDYPSVAELYAAIKGLPNIEIDYNSIEDRLCSELVQFADVQLVSYFKKTTVIRDATKIYIPYAINNDWHEVEIATLGANTYLVCNGMMNTYAGYPIYGNGNTELSFGGNCQCLFKDIEIDTSTSCDAELVVYNGTHLISEFNPFIMMWEGHGMDVRPSNEVPVHADNMDTTPDRIQYVFELMNKKGYTAISINDLMDFYQQRKKLPKRCFLMMFDDFRYDNYLTLKNRSVFTRYNVKPCICTNTDRYPNTFPLVMNGVDITPEKAYMVGKLVNFDNVTHTRDHRRITDKKYSQYESEFVMDINDADKMNVQSNALVYPYGAYDLYAIYTMRWLGFNLGVRVVNGRANRRYTDPMLIARVEIGLRSGISNVKKVIV